MLGQRYSKYVEQIAVEGLPPLEGVGGTRAAQPAARKKDYRPTPRENQTWRRTTSARPPPSYRDQHQVANQNTICRVARILGVAL